jgi:hypothetical protein
MPKDGAGDDRNENILSSNFHWLSPSLRATDHTRNEHSARHFEEACPSFRSDSLNSGYNSALAWRLISTTSSSVGHYLCHREAWVCAAIGEIKLQGWVSNGRPNGRKPHPTTCREGRSKPARWRAIGDAESNDFVTFISPRGGMPNLAGIALMS